MMIEESYFQHMSEPDLEKCYKWPLHLTYQPFANEFVKCLPNVISTNMAVEGYFLKEFNMTT